MKLYYSPGACSLSPHIVAREAGVDLQLVRVDLKTHETEHGDDYYAINPRGYVPLLELADGTLLREGPVIVQFLADQVPDRKLAPPAGTMGRAAAARVADLHRHGAAQAVLLVVSSRSRRDSTGAAGENRERPGAARATPCLIRLPARRTVHRRRRVCVYSGELVQSREHRSAAISSSARISRARGRPTEGSGSAARRGFAQGLSSLLLHDYGQRLAPSTSH